MSFGYATEEFEVTEERLGYVLFSGLLRSLWADLCAVHTKHMNTLTTQRDIVSLPTLSRKQCLR
jgi:hypothetical protein